MGLFHREVYQAARIRNRVIARSAEENRGIPAMSGGRRAAPGCVFVTLLAVV
jgi:hypothetical protein